MLQVNDSRYGGERRPRCPHPLHTTYIKGCGVMARVTPRVTQSAWLEGLWERTACMPKTEVKMAKRIGKSCATWGWGTRRMPCSTNTPCPLCAHAPGGHAMSYSPLAPPVVVRLLSCVVCWSCVWGHDFGLMWRETQQTGFRKRGPQTKTELERQTRGSRQTRGAAQCAHRLTADRRNTQIKK